MEPTQPSSNSSFSSLLPTQHNPTSLTDGRTAATALSVLNNSSRSQPALGRRPRSPTVEDATNPKQSRYAEAASSSSTALRSIAHLLPKINVVMLGLIPESDRMAISALRDPYTINIEIQECITRHLKTPGFEEELREKTSNFGFGGEVSLRAADILLDMGVALFDQSFHRGPWGLAIEKLHAPRAYEQYVRAWQYEGRSSSFSLGMLFHGVIHSNNTTTLPHLFKFIANDSARHEIVLKSWLEVCKTYPNSIEERTTKVLLDYFKSVDFSRREELLKKCHSELAAEVHEAIRWIETPHPSGGTLNCGSEPLSQEEAIQRYRNDLCKLSKATKDVEAVLFQRQRL